MNARLLTVIAVWLGCGCSEDLQRQSEVTGLRLLAMAAEPPEAAPAEPVIVQALWSDPPGPDTPSFRWSVCAAAADGSIDRCDGPETPLLPLGSDDATALQAPAASGTELVRLSICRGSFAADGECQGEGVRGAKRVIVSDADDPNHNPFAATLLLDDAAAGGAPIPAGAEVVVALEAGPGSAETLGDGREEELIVSWFSTGGSFEDDRSFGPQPERFETTWTAPDEPATVTMWAVLRDGRGGVAWTSADLSIE